MSQPAQQIRFCTSRDGTRIAYATSGEGPPLIWLGHWVRHLKLDWDSPVWRPWLSLLTRRHRLIRYDFRGFGLSDRDGVPFSPEKLFEDFEAVVAAAGLECFVFLGSAIGAAMAMTHAARHPERITHLAIYGGYTRAPIARATSPEQRALVEARYKVIEHGWPNETPGYGQFFTTLHMPDANAEQFRSFNELLRLTTSPANAIAFLRSFAPMDLRTVVPQIRCPTLVLHARQDGVIPFDEGRSVAGLIPGARFVPLESRNHILLDTEPAWQQFVEALDDFLPAPAKPAGTGDPLFDELTARERDVLELVAQGLDNATIGARLHISERTARNHVSTILAKLGINTRSQAIVRAREAGFGREKLA